MGSDKKKLCRIIRSGHYLELKRFSRKNCDFDFSQRLDSSGRTALHLACKKRHPKMVSYLLNKARVDPLTQDCDGTVTLLLAMKLADRYCHGSTLHCNCAKIHLIYKKIVLPLVKASPLAISVSNRREECGQTYFRKAQEYVDSCRCARFVPEHLELITILHLIEECVQEYLVPEETTDEWDRKMEDEMEFEQSNFEGAFFNDSDSECYESYDKWAERMRQEHRTKQEKERQRAYRGSSRDENASTSKSSWTPQDQEAFERQQRELEELRRKKLRDDGLSKKRKLYDELVSTLFGDENRPISPSDIPDDEGLVEVLRANVPSGSELKTYLKEQQYLWHPDKFSQKCNHRIPEPLREQIMNKVNQISQCINATLQTV